jgi:hypothetical protein
MKAEVCVLNNATYDSRIHRTEYSHVACSGQKFLVHYPPIYIYLLDPEPLIIDALLPFLPKAAGLFVYSRHHSKPSRYI